MVKTTHIPSGEDEILNALMRLWEDQFPARENIRIQDLMRISDGWENDVYAFTVEYEDAAGQTREDLILRIYPGDDARQKSAREFHTMKRLHGVGFPVPEVLLLACDNSPFGKPCIVMEKIQGRSMGEALGESSDPEKHVLLERFCQLFVDLHALDWRPIASDPLLPGEDSSTLIKRQLSRWQDYAHALQETAFDPVFAWLQEHIPDIRFNRLSVLHWDYHPGNILIREDGAPFVIDWGGVLVSDFRLDLAWTLLLMSTYGHPEAREVVLTRYERAAGVRVEQIEYFEAAMCLRRLFDISVSLGAGAERLGMRPGAETMMRQNVDHIERVYMILCDRTGLTIPEIDRLLSTLT